MYGGSQQQWQQPPRHAGLGAGGGHLAAQQPRTTGFVAALDTGSSWTGERFSLFVGGIAGIDDGWLERILGTVGPVLSIRRPSPPFAFVEYGDAESVLRCLEAVNGTKIATRAAGNKVLLVKADEKTRARLDEYETTRVKNERTTDMTAQAVDELSAIAALIVSGSAPLTAGIMAPGDGRLPSNGHLQDLTADDLPAASRGVITSEIAMFRQRAAKMEVEKRESEMRRTSAQGNQYRLQEQRQRQNQSYGSQQGFGPASVDPQSYNKPIGFVASGVTPIATVMTGRADGKGETKPAPPVVDLELNERERIERARRDNDAAFLDRERRFEQKERARINGVERERARERATADAEDRERVAMRERLALWDDDAVAQGGRELFYTDRPRWHEQRRRFKRAEVEGDARDAKAEAQQAAALQKQADDFLALQAESLGMPSARTPATSTSILPVNAGDEPLVKLMALPKAVAKPPPIVRNAAMLLAAQEEEDASKVRRTLVKLNYSDDEEDRHSKNSGGTSRAREKRERETRAAVPETQEQLWSYVVDWSALSEVIIKDTVGPFINSCIVDVLGAPEAEILDAVLEHLRAHKSAAELVEELAAVLDEEAGELVSKVWKVLIYETMMAR